MGCRIAKRPSAASLVAVSQIPSEQSIRLWLKTSRRIVQKVGFLANRATLHWRRRSPSIEPFNATNEEDEWWLRRMRQR